MCGSWAQREAKWMRRAGWQLLLFGIRNSGAAFIKWGQWSATREDLFPSVCALHHGLTTFSKHLGILLDGNYCLILAMVNAATHKH